jgi:dGTPase
LIEKRNIAQHRLQRMFDLLTSRVDMLPGRFQDRASEVGLKRAVGDYLAGMTDRYLENCFEQQFPAG